MMDTMSGPVDLGRGGGSEAFAVESDRLRRLLAPGLFVALSVAVQEIVLERYEKHPRALTQVDRKLPYLYAADRKSTRLNSSHTVISYAVFCLKKKRKSSHEMLSCRKL